MHDRVAELGCARRNGMPLDVVLLAVDLSQRSGLVAAVVLANEQFDLMGEAQEATIEVARDPLPPGLGDALWRPYRVVPLVLAEQDDLGSVSLTA